MNNRYLFRGKRLNNGDWVQGFLFKHLWKGWCIGIEPLSTNTYGDIFDCCYKEIDPATVGQWTGLYDSTKWEDLTPQEQEDFADSFEDERHCNPQEHWRGRLIFEGDVLQSNGMNFNSTVKYNNLTGSFCAFYSSLHDSEERYEVIGNAHDNPELLERLKP